MFTYAKHAVSNRPPWNANFSNNCRLPEALGEMVSLFMGERYKGGNIADNCKFIILFN